MGKTEVELFMKIEKNVYKLGDKIPVHVECTVKGSSDVDKVCSLGFPFFHCINSKPFCRILFASNWLIICWRFSCPPFNWIFGQITVFSPNY